MAPPKSEEDDDPLEAPPPKALPSLVSARFLLLLGVQFLFGLGFSSFLLLPKYLTQVHAANSELIGHLMAAGPLAAVLVIPLVAARLDRVPRHYLLFGAAITMMLGSLGFAALEGLGLPAYALRGLHGAAFTIFVSTTLTLTIDLAPPARLGQAVGLIGAANLATNALGPAIAEPVADAYGWRTVFILSGCFSFLAAFGAIAFRERRVPRPQAAKARFEFTPRFGRLLYAGVIVGVAFGTVLTFYQPLALELGIHDLSHWFVGYTLSALGIRVLGGAFLDRFDRKKLALGASALYAVAVFATALLQPGWLFTLGFTLGFAHGTLWPVLTALTVEGTNSKTRTAVLTYFGGSFNVGVTLSTLGFGTLAHAIGYRSVIALAGALAASSSFVLARLNEAPPEPESVRSAR
ncbi:MAG TPA: MFS transporter [Polyangiaceae bacterium]|nr:MFS transporter [Polyangiaceae bacterium]